MTSALKRVLLVLLLALPVFAANGVLENQDIRLEVSGADGSIVRILDKSSGTEFIGDAKKARLFRLYLPQPGYLARRIESRGQTIDTPEITDGTMVLRFHNLQVSQKKYFFQQGVFNVPEPRLPIDATVTFRLDGPHIIGTLAVENRSMDEVTDVMFPWVAGLNSTLAEKPRIVVPALSNRVITPAPGFLVGERALRYPGILATTWISYGADKKSIALEARSGPETQDALFSLGPHGGIAENSPSYWEEPDFPYIAWGFFPHIAGHCSWRSPEVVIHVHEADWHAVAAEHRDWYREAFKPAASTAFRNEIGFATYSLKDTDDTINWRYQQIPELAQDAKAAGLHSVVIKGWRQHETLANEVPFDEVADSRLGGGALLKELIGQLQAKGIELIFTFHATLINTASKVHQEQVVRWTAKSRRQANQPQPAYTFYTNDYPYLEEAERYWASLDPSSASTDYLLEQAKRLRDQYGFRNLLLRGVGLQSYLSYNKERSVPPQMVFVTGYHKFLGGLHNLYPGMLLMEGLNDLVNRYSAAAYTWDQITNSDVLALSVPWTPFSTDIEALEYGKANAAFAHKILINLIVDGGNGTVKRYPEFARHLQSLRALKQSVAPYYSDAEFRDHEGLEGFSPAVNTLISTFRNAASGQTGIVLANLANAKVTVPLKLASTVALGSGRLMRSGGTPEMINLSDVQVSLSPYEVAVLCIDPQKAQKQ